MTRLSVERQLSPPPPRKSADSGSENKPFRLIHAHAGQAWACCVFSSLKVELVHFSSCSSSARRIQMVSAFVMQIRPLNHSAALPLDPRRPSLGSDSAAGLCGRRLFASPERRRSNGRFHGSGPGAAEWDQEEAAGSSVICRRTSRGRGKVTQTWWGIRRNHEHRAR